MVSGPISYLHNMFDYSKLGPQFSHVVSALKISDKHSKYKGEYDFNMTADEQRGQAAHSGHKNCGRNYRICPIKRALRGGNDRVYVYLLVKNDNISF